MSEATFDPTPILNYTAAGLIAFGLMGLVVAILLWALLS